MSAFTKIDMIAATRLTRQGRLTEAMAVLRGKPADMPLHAAPAAFRQDAPPGATLSSVPQMLRGLLGRVGPSGRARELGGHDAASLPKGARFEERSFAGAAGSLTYKLFIPGSWDGEKLPLIVMLHGCTQSPDDFAAGTRMNEIGEERTFLVAYPAQTQSANASKCWNWFKPGDQKRDRGEPALIAGITRQIMRDFPVAPGQVYIAGMSAGGAAAAVMGAAYPDLYAAIGIHSGLPCGAASDMPSAFAAMRQGASSATTRPQRGSAEQMVRTIVFHGDSDKTVNPVNGDQIMAQATATELRASIIEGETPSGVRFTRTVKLDKTGRPVLEQWVLHGVGHAWSGGSTAGSYTDPRGPDASREMVRFFLGAGG